MLLQCYLLGALPIICCHRLCAWALSISCYHGLHVIYQEHCQLGTTVIQKIFSVMLFSLLSKETKIRNLKMHFYIRFWYKKLKLKTMYKKNLE